MQYVLYNCVLECNNILVHKAICVSEFCILWCLYLYFFFIFVSFTNALLYLAVQFPAASMPIKFVSCFRRISTLNVKTVLLVLQFSALKVLNSLLVSQLHVFRD